MWACNWDSLRAFQACETQWRIVGGFVSKFWSGLDYVAVDIVLRRRGCSDNVFADIQVMEKAAIDTFLEVSE